jgi:hypothetical protein
MHIVLQPMVQAMAESNWHFDHSFVAVQLDHVAGAIEHGGAVLASAKVLFHGCAQRGIDLTL